MAALLFSDYMGFSVFGDNILTQIMRAVKAVLCVFLIFHAKSSLATVQVFLKNDSGSVVIQNDASKFFHKRMTSFLKSQEKFTRTLNSQQLADIDLINLWNQDIIIARLPRFIVVRNWVKSQLSADQTLSFLIQPKSKILLPNNIFSLSKVTKIELTNSSLEYPNTRLIKRANPTALRGEKFFIQNCLTCHGLPDKSKLSIQQTVKKLLAADMNNLNVSHLKRWDQQLNERDIRGLLAYQEEMMQQNSNPVKVNP